MRMANGGFSPGYNVQLATDAAHGVIVGVRVTNNGSDSGQAPPMIEQIEQRTGRRPQEYLVDAAYTDQASVDALAAAEILLYGAVPERAGKVLCVALWNALALNLMRWFALTSIG